MSYGICGCIFFCGVNPSGCLGMVIGMMHSIADRLGIFKNLFSVIFIHINYQRLNFNFNWWTLFFAIMFTHENYNKQFLLMLYYFPLTLNLFKNVIIIITNCIDCNIRWMALPVGVHCWYSFVVLVFSGALMTHHFKQFLF